MIKKIFLILCADIFSSILCEKHLIDQDAIFYSISIVNRAINPSRAIIDSPNLQREDEKGDTNSRRRSVCILFPVFPRRDSTTSLIAHLLPTLAEQTVRELTATTR